MGCNMSSENEGAILSKKIDASLGKDGKDMKNEIKILLVGPGESGKSTFFKQMMILAREEGYSKEELLGYVSKIHANVVGEMQVMINYGFNHDLFEEDEELKEICDTMMGLTPNELTWSQELVDYTEKLWGHDLIKDIYSKRDKEFQLNDSAAYFFENVGRFADVENYVPTEMDVLRCRTRSTGIEEAEFNFEGMKFRMLDVGGQRNERRKWIHCFDCVTTVMFCTSLAEYDQSLREDRTMNRMKESLHLFQDISNSPWFRDVPVVLFLNKMDIFHKKILEVPLSVCFPEYEGENNFEEASEYIKGKFLELPEGNKTVFTHITCAVDTENVEVVFKIVKETLLRQTLTEIVM